jgi:hypothetical protein
MNVRSRAGAYIQSAAIENFGPIEPLSRGNEHKEYVLNGCTLANTVRTRTKRIFNRSFVQNVFYHNVGSNKSERGWFNHSNTFRSTLSKSRDQVERVWSEQHGTFRTSSSERIRMLVYSTFALVRTHVRFCSLFRTCSVTVRLALGMTNPGTEDENTLKEKETTSGWLRGDWTSLERWICPKIERQKFAQIEKKLTFALSCETA